MSDMTHQHKLNLSTSSAAPTETGGRVQPPSASSLLSLQATPESTPEDHKTLWLGIAWKAEYWPDAGRTKVGAQGPTDAANGRTARPVACEQTIASLSVVHRWRQLSQRGYHAEADGSSGQGHVIPGRGGLSHG
jgi:hypothetical protein